MTYNKLTVTLASLALAISASACDNGLTDVNRNPNAPEKVNPSLLFPQATVSSIQRVRADMEITPSAFVHWPQYMAEYQYPEISFYQFRPTTSDGWWSNFYTGPIEDLEQALRQTNSATNNRPNMTGPILVVRAFDYSTMTGIWGDIPFGQAGKGDSGTFTPTYDSQQVVYDSLLTNLKDANAMMDASLTSAGFGDQDPVYAGDVDQWKKFANSLRARLGLNLQRIDPTRAAAEVSAAIAAGGFTSNADNAQITWPGDGVSSNPWCATEKEGNGCGGTRDDARMSVTFIDSLKNSNDPRLAVFARPVQDPTCTNTPSCTPVAAGDYRGMPNGLLAGQAGNWGPKSSRPGTQIFEPTQPSYFMTYAEFSFIKAEAAERGWIAGGPAAAATYYIDGITASMDQWGVDAASTTAYLAQPAVVYAGGAAGLRQIAVQKWVALFTQGFESWSEWRRTGFPNLVPAANATTANGEIPRRVIYPQTEQSFNNVNLQAAITAQGGSDALDKKLWIDP